MATARLNPTRNSLPAAARAEVIGLLNSVMADLSDLHSQAKQAHWNVRGKHFQPLHQLFDAVAETAEGPIDDIAERAVQLGGYARGTVRMAAAGSRLPDWPEDLTEEHAFVTTLAERFAIVANAVREAIDTAARAGDADTADLFTEVSRDLDKSLWMLEASQ